MTTKEKFAEFLATPARIWLFCINWLCGVPFTLTTFYKETKAPPSSHNIIADFDDIGASIILKTDANFTPPSNDEWIKMMKYFANKMMES